MSLPVKIATWIFVPAFLGIIGWLLWEGLIKDVVRLFKSSKKKKAECDSCKRMDPTMTFCSVCGSKLK